MLQLRVVPGKEFALNPAFSLLAYPSLSDRQGEAAGAKLMS